MSGASESQLIRVAHCRRRSVVRSPALAGRRVDVRSQFGIGLVPQQGLEHYEMNLRNSRRTIVVLNYDRFESATFMPKPINIILGTVSLIACVAVVAFLAHIAHPRIVARAVTPDGTELCIVQECNWDPEMFATSFVYHKPGSRWRWFYYDHQDGYWGSARVKLDTNANVAVFYRGGSPAVTFRWDSEIYTLHRLSRTLTNAPENLPANWTPQTSLHSGGR